jgi:hypothetical protein
MTRRDYKAEYGHEPDWHLQREKQETIAKNRDARLHGEVINDDS